MFDNLLTDIAPVIIGIVIIILVGVVLAFLLRGRSSKKSSRAAKMDSKLSQDAPLTDDMDMGEKKEAMKGVQDFGLHLVLDNDQVVNFDLPATIGRSEDNSLVVEDESVSSYHAKIFYDEYIGAICIEDTGSLNGIFIDGRPTIKNVLDDGARLTLGSYSLTFRDTGYLPKTK